MNTRQPALLLHPVFLTNLIILLLNDHYLKGYHNNWITGKLSDFCGVFVFAVFFIAILPINKKIFLAFTAFLFAWWKSPLSEPFITYLNNSLSIPVYRVIDYSDLAALLTLPFAYYIKRLSSPSTYLKQVAVYIIGITALFSFCATSVARSIIYYPRQPNEIVFNESFYTRLSEGEILKRLNPFQLIYSKDSVRYYKVIESEDFYYRVSSANDSNYIWLPVSNKLDSVLYVKRIEPGFYTIPLSLLNNDTLVDLQISIRPSGPKKGMVLKVESFQIANGTTPADFYDGKLPARYKRYFTKLLR
jgi:hypothetical protein